jgi:hypothetical protein
MRRGWRWQRCARAAGALCFAQVAGAAAEVHAVLLPARPAALNLGVLDLGRAHGQRQLAAWLAAAPHDSAARNG